MHKNNFVLSFRLRLPWLTFLVSLPPLPHPCLVISLLLQVAGIRIGSLLEVLISLVAALAVAFAYSWLTALVILGFMPMVVLASITHYSIANSNQARSLEALRESSQVSLLHTTPPYPMLLLSHFTPTSGLSGGHAQIVAEVLPVEWVVCGRLLCFM